MNRKHFRKKLFSLQSSALELLEKSLKQRLSPFEFHALSPDDCDPHRSLLKVDKIWIWSLSSKRYLRMKKSVTRWVSLTQDQVALFNYLKDSKVSQSHDLIAGRKCPFLKNDYQIIRHLIFNGFIEPFQRRIA